MQSKGKNMTIKKEFVPLILNGTKKHEYKSNKRDYSGFYLINNQIWELKFWGRIKYDEYLDQEKESGIDELSKEFIKNNKQYFVCNSIINDFEIVVYFWKKIEMEQLEII